MAGVFASMAVKWALDKLASFRPAASSSSTTAATASQDLELLRMLERTMRRILATLRDAEEHWDIREESAKLRLRELKELAYAAEDVVEEYENEVDRCDVEATAIASNRKRKRPEENGTYSNVAALVPVPIELAVQARKIIERFDEIKEYADKFALSENDGERRFPLDITSFRKTSSVMYEKSILGREKDKDKVVQKLLSIQGNNVSCPVSVLAIVGMGGLGKTTLAQLVYNDPRVRQSFDVWAWVCVSEKFDVCIITKNIISSLTRQECLLSELGDLQEKLADEMKEKRVLLVLDDVWSDRSEAWWSLCKPMSKSRVCKIIVTTRSETVARVVQTMPFYRINGLTSEESWSLFKQVAFTVDQYNATPATLVEIGRNIVEKCKGLPLAIKVLGSSLRFQPDEMEWKNVLESKLWDLEQSRNEVLPALELSYKHMSMDLKRCFLAFSLLPKDYVLHKCDVIRLWKSLDLLQCDGNGTQGYKYFNELVQWSFLQVYVENETYGMHDLIHDLACFVAADEFFRFEGDTSIEIPPTVRYISTIEYGAVVKTLTASHSLRAIVILDGHFLDKGSFIDLRQLHQGDTTLQDHNFLDGHELQGGLPLNCKKLRAITHFDGPRSIHHMILPRRIGCGINLHTLPEMEISCGCRINLNTPPAVEIKSYGCSSGGNISELRNMNKLRELSLHGLCNVACIEDAKGAQLQSKNHLQSLALGFDRKMHFCENKLEVTLSHEQLLGSLRPHHVLRKLEISDYESERYPSWLGNALFSNLTVIELYKLESPHLPTLGELPSLKFLHVNGIDYVEYIGRKFCSHSSGVKGFPSLERLHFNVFWQLSEWEVDIGDFPCLHTLSIDNVPKLRSLPSVLFMSLVTLNLRDCENVATIPASATLRELQIRRCEDLHQLPTLISLWKLKIQGCPSLSAVGSLPSLTTLNLNGPFDDEEVLYRLLNCHSSLECITFICKTTTRVPLLPKSLPALTKFRLSCPNLQYCDGLAGLTSLKELKLWGCSNLPMHSLHPRNLDDLDIRDEEAWNFEHFDRYY